jgi:hypothetical protein
LADQAKRDEERANGQTEPEEDYEKAGERAVDTAVDGWYEQYKDSEERKAVFEAATSKARFVGPLSHEQRAARERSVNIFPDSATETAYEDFHSDAAFDERERKKKEEQEAARKKRNEELDKTAREELEAAEAAEKKEKEEAAKKKKDEEERKEEEERKKQEEAAKKKKKDDAEDERKKK